MQGFGKMTLADKEAVFKFYLLKAGIFRIMGQ